MTVDKQIPPDSNGSDSGNGVPGRERRRGMARPRGAIASALKRIPDFQHLNSAALAGHARLFIHPAYTRLVNSEPYVKRLIPILIVLFVVALVLMRVVALYQS